MTTNHRKGRKYHPEKHNKTLMQLFPKMTEELRIKIMQELNEEK